MTAWLRERERYLEYAVKKTNFKNKKSPDNPYVFPFKYNVARVMWNNLLEKAGFNEKDSRTDRYKMHIHTLRKYFRTRMTLTIPADVVEALMGHEEQLTQVYRRYSEQQLAEMYIKAEQQIVVFKTPLDVTEIEKSLGKLRSENLQLRQDLNRVMDMLIEKSKPQIDLTPPKVEGAQWHTYSDGSIQLVDFDKEKRDFVPVGNRIPKDKINDARKHSEEWFYYRDKYNITVEDIYQAITEKVEKDKKERISEKKLERWIKQMEMEIAYREKYGEWPY